MKKQYQKPVLLVEDFMLDTSIANGSACMDYSDLARDSFEIYCEEWGIDNPTEQDFQDFFTVWNSDDKNSKGCYFTYALTNFSS